MELFCGTGRFGQGDRMLIACLLTCTTSLSSISLAIGRAAPGLTGICF